LYYKQDDQNILFDFNAMLLKYQGFCIQYQPPLTVLSVSTLIAKIKEGMKTGMTLEEIDNYAAEVSASMIPIHFEYGIMAARISITSLHENTDSDFYNVMKREEKRIHPIIPTEVNQYLGNDLLYSLEKNREAIQKKIDYSKDFNLTYFGFKTLKHGYLYKQDKKTIERPQHMWMKVALGIWPYDLVKAFETYDLMSNGEATHATPTLFNSGTKKNQMSSCFLLSGIKFTDSMEGISDFVKQIMIILAGAGGIGISISHLRATDAYIAGSNGTGSGLRKLLQVLNAISLYVDQGGGKRNGSIAIYLEPWHADVVEFIKMRGLAKQEKLLARDLFYALWTPDLFMKRVEEDGKWSLFSPDEAPGLNEVWGKEFEDLYEKYEATPKLARKVMDAREIWFLMRDSRIETGLPYMLFKDTLNKYSNQQNLGTIKLNNLCCEINQYSSPDEISVCNLASVALPKCLELDDHKKYTFNHKKLRNIVRILARNLNHIVDINYYSLEQTKRSNLRHRPMGIGIQGLADVFILMKLPYDSEEARVLNREIFETMYFSALEMSCELAQEEGTYPSYKEGKGSPVSNGKLCFDLRGVTPSDRWDWSSLREKIAQHGIRNSLLIAMMPTATTAQILGNTECDIPASNISLRSVLSGTFYIISKPLIETLSELGLWNERVREELLLYRGSIQKIKGIPDDIKKLFRTVWEIPQMNIMRMAVDRAAFIDQNQSSNFFIAEPNTDKIDTLLFTAWREGLGTGMYYLHTQPAENPIPITISSDKLNICIENTKGGKKRKVNSVEEIIATVFENEKKKIKTTAKESIPITLSSDNLNIHSNGTRQTRKRKVNNEKETIVTVFENEKKKIKTIDDITAMFEKATETKIVRMINVESCSSDSCSS
jgi:ribonucleoside-diphosphate reductase alpha subunit